MSIIIKDVFEFPTLTVVEPKLSCNDMDCLAVVCAMRGVTGLTPRSGKRTVFGVILRWTGCRKKMSLAKESMFPELKMDVTKLLGLIYFWGAQTSVAVTATHLGMSSRWINL